MTNVNPAAPVAIRPALSEINKVLVGMTVRSTKTGAEGKVVYIDRNERFGSQDPYVYIEWSREAATARYRSLKDVQLVQANRGKISGWWQSGLDFVEVVPSVVVPGIVPSH